MASYGATMTMAKLSSPLADETELSLTTKTDDDDDAAATAWLSPRGYAISDSPVLLALSPAAELVDPMPSPLADTDSAAYDPDGITRDGWRSSITGQKGLGG